MFDEVRFDLRLTPSGALTVHCSSRALPEEWADTVGPEVLDQLRLLRERLGRHQITEAELLRLGLLLGDALVPGDVQPSLAHQLATTGVGLRLRIVTHEPELAALPWEYVRMPSQFDDLGGAPLALDERVSVVRSPGHVLADHQPTLRGASQLSVLHASATAVTGFDDLRGDDHAVDLALWGDAARPARRVVLDRLSDPASRASLDEALTTSPDLLVFTGHSTIEAGQAALVLADDRGDPELVSGEELASMVLRHGAPLVVLNACDTAASGDGGLSLAEQLVRRGVPAVVGMQMPISDSNAGHFAVGLIGALGDGASIDAAVTRGRTRVAARAGYAEWGIPTLVTASTLVESDPVPAAMRTVVTTEGSSGSGEAVATLTRGPLATRPAVAEPVVGVPTGHQRHPVRDPEVVRRPVRRAVGIVTAVAIVAALLGAGWWVTRDGAEDDAASTERTTRTTGQADPDGAAEAFGEIFHNDGFLDAAVLPDTSLADTTPELKARIEEFGTTLGTLGLTDNPPPLGPEVLKWPGSPIEGKFAATNGRRNPECWRVGLSSVVGVGASGNIWLGTQRGAAVHLAQFDSAETAQRYYWASSLFAGLGPRECDGWPEDGRATDPTALEVNLRQFNVSPSGDAPTPDDLLTTRSPAMLDEFGFASAYVAVFRYGDTVALVAVGSFNDSLDEQSALQTISTAMQVLAP